MSIGDVGVGVEGIGATSPFAPELTVVPSISFNLTVNPPKIIENDIIAIPSAAFNLTANPPITTISELVLPPSKSFTFAANPPIAFATETLQIPSATFTFTSNPPTIGNIFNIAIPTKQFTFTANAPDILFDSKLLDRTINSSETAEVYLILLTIVHSDLPESVRISNDPTQLWPIAGVKGTISNGDEYIYLPFDFIFPNQEADTSPRAQLRIDNVSREIYTIIDSITSSPTIQIQVVLSSTPDIVELELLDFKLQRTEGNITTVIGDLTIEHYELEPFPVGRFHPSGFPGLFAN